MMPTISVPQKASTRERGADIEECCRSASDAEVALLTGCRDRHYVYGLAKALMARNVRLDIIGSDEVDCAEFHDVPHVKFFNLGGQRERTDSVVRKIIQTVVYYCRLLHYTAATQKTVLHVLWNYKLEYFDRTILMLYYKLLGKRVVLTAHNVNAGRRDSNDSLLNRVTLRAQYRLVDHIFVHTEQMKSELMREFGVGDRTISVIPYGINNATPSTSLSTSSAKRRLGIRAGEKVILFFGNIGPYKGLEHLIDAFHKIVSNDHDCRLMIAGKPRSGSAKYVSQIREATQSDVESERVIQRIEHIPDDEIELYFKAADVLVLPYTHVFQSGVLFLGYSFGLPVIATDVGSLRDDVVEGETGFLCRPSDSGDLAMTIEKYFRSDLFKNLGTRRHEIQSYAERRHSWDRVGELTESAYAGPCTPVQRGAAARSS
jgi:D-inositol-3-phosphate glycosyltransferase